MKAIVSNRYGSPEVLQLEEIEIPIPNDKEVRIQVHATTITLGDCEMRELKIQNLMWLLLRLYMGIRKPRNKVLGQELAGEIEFVGDKVTNFKVGDRVFAPTDMKFGAHAEYRCLPSTHPIAMIPEGVSFAEAATIPTGGLNALHFIRKAKLQPGERIMIVGAGGSIGTYAVQLAKTHGAVVTCVDSGIKLDMLRSIGADYVIDYTKEDFTENGKRYEVILDIVGKNTYRKCLKSLVDNGRFILGNPTFTSMFSGLWTSMTTNKNVMFELAAYRIDDMNYLANEIATGRLNSVIDKHFALSEVPDAHRYVDRGLKSGNIVINL